MLYGELANESAAYRAARAELRRQLPVDTEMEDYLFHEGPRDLSQDVPISASCRVRRRASKRISSFRMRTGISFYVSVVFVKKADGALAHYYSASAIMGEGEYRGIDLLTPAGRQEDWYPDTEYGN